MRSKRILIEFLGFATFAVPATSSAIPLDLSGFTPFESISGSVTETAGTVRFIENGNDAAIYFYNDIFTVGMDAALLSFDYDFRPEDGSLDYLQLNVNFTEQWKTDGTGTGHITFDLTPYRGQSIALDWGLIWDGSSGVGAEATIFNIDLASSPAAPVPEPATLILLGTGLTGLVCARRKQSRT